ncbi:MAG: hypothetical protein V3T05_05315 [Myxococcota bacterium]
MSRIVGTAAVSVLLAGCGGQLLIRHSGTCESSAECSPGYQCQSGVCAQANADQCSPSNPTGTCPGGERCHNGECVTNLLCCDGCVPPQVCQACECKDPDPGNICSQFNPDGECENADEVCVGGFCTATDCSTDGLGCFCPSGAACVNGFCELISERPCSASDLDGRCPAGQVCSDTGQCMVVVCSSTVPCGTCGPDQVCADGTCVLMPCSLLHISGSCEAGKFCSVEGECILDGTCNEDGDCTVANTFCSQIGECIADGTCADPLDCPTGEFCAVAGQCVANGTCVDDRDCNQATEYCDSTSFCRTLGDCGSELDCPPGYICNSSSCVLGPACTTNNRTTVGCPADQVTCCPAGQTCCPLGQRCSADGSCILLGECIDSTDCPPNHTCVDYNCVPNTTCTPGTGTGCPAGEKCTADGACIPDPKCASSADCPDGENCSGTFQCEIECECGCQPYTATLVPPNMLIVIDRSGSMNGCVGSSGPQYTRWNIARASLDSVMNANRSQIRFGLSTYPQFCPGSSLCGTTTSNDCGSGNCTNSCNWNNVCATFSSQATCDAYSPCAWNTGGGGQCEPLDPNIDTGNNYVPGDVDVPVGDDQVDAIIAALNPPTSPPNPQHPGGYTPTGRTMRNIAAKRDQFGLPDPADTTARGNYIMLVTDGEANGAGGTYGVCDGGGRSAAEEVDCAEDFMRAASPPIKTFVVGFVGGSAADLNCNAVHGGTSRCGTPAECAAFGNQTACEALEGCTWGGGSCGGGIDDTNCNTTSVTCFYNADNATELSNAFATIAGRIASCTYNIDPPPPTWSRLFVYLDYPGTLPTECNGINPCRLEESATTWTRDVASSSINFHATYCDDLQSAAAAPLILFGCCVGEGC